MPCVNKLYNVFRLSKSIRHGDNPMSEKQLLPNRHPQTDIFICDMPDATAKDDIASMEHPIFTLSLKPDLQVRRYENGDNWFEVSPSVKGSATINDKDILIFAVSQIMAAKQAGKPYSKHISFTAYDFLVFSNRMTNGQGYEGLKSALERLRGTTLTTNIRRGEEEQWDAFGLIDKARIRRKRRDGRVIEWGLTLSDWLFNAIESNNVLTLNPLYFRLRKPLEKRLYEIARKHCGNQKEWRIHIDLLQKKCGSNSVKAHFKRMLRKVCEYDYMPDYKVDIIGSTVLFTRTGVVGKSNTKQLAHYITCCKIPPLKTSTFEKFRKAHKGYDPYFLEQQWREWSANKEPPNNPDLAFLSWAETWVANHPY